MAKAAADRQRLYVYNGGFLTQTRTRRILDLAGYDVKLGKPGADDLVGIWGQSPTSPRGEKVAAHTGTGLLRVEDAFLRSVLTGRDGDHALGLVLDKRGVHFDAATPSDLEVLLSTHALDDTSLLDRARRAMQWIKRAQLSKYNAFASDTAAPEPGYVLVVDQTEGDASVTASGANAATFREMLVFAQEEHPGARVLIKTHPETQAGHRSGYFTDADTSARVSLVDAPISPWALFEGAVGVYTVSSQLGFEAIFAGHKPRVFGQPFYAGWGLTQDERPVPRRERVLTRAQLFAAAMILYPTWYDPYGDQLCELEDVIAALEARARAWREDHQGWAAQGMRMWKRKHIGQVYGSVRPVRFDASPEGNAREMIWASKAAEGQEIVRVEDGFLRSRGLGASLIPPLSLVADDLGIYYDPRRESRLERWIAASADLPDAALERAEHLITSLIDARLSKYNLAGAAPDLPTGRRILVPGQVEDDASITTGTDDIRTNRDLLLAARAANPDAVILYKPHPDVEAGLRPGAIDAAGIADLVLEKADPVALLEQVDAVWTMTSLLGFEALLRGVPVTCLGTPFYCGWGLTEDRGKVPARRRARPSLAGLVHATLIDYPRYFDPLTRSACPVEVIVERLAKDDIPAPGPFNRSLSKLQGLFASQAHLWRRS